MSLFGRKIFSITIITILFMSIGSLAFADNASSTKQVEQKRRLLKERIESLNVIKKREMSKLNHNQKKLEKNQKTLEKSQKQLKNKKATISSLQKELDSYMVKYNAKQKANANRIRHIYMTKHSLVLDILMSTNSISQFLDRVYYQNLIIKADKEKMFSLKKEAQNIYALQDKMKKEQKELAIIISDINKTNKNIKATIREKESVIKNLERKERQLLEQSEQLTQIITKATKGSNVVADKGFIRPVSGRITSPFGYRIHPIFKSRKFHTGLDYEAAMSTPIKAANSGKVIYTGWYGGYGKVVIIDHGSCTGAPTTSLYAHMSRPKVSVGQNVVKGQIIGLSGSTGYSTGPHLHFEIRINGKPQNPNNFL